MLVRKREKKIRQKKTERKRERETGKKGKWSGFVKSVRTYNIHVSAKPTKICNLFYYQKLGTEPTRHDGEKKCTSYEVT